MPNTVPKSRMFEVPLFTLFLSPGCLKYHFSAIVPDKAGAATNQALQKGPATVYDRGTWQEQVANVPQNTGWTVHQ